MALEIEVDGPARVEGNKRRGFADVTFDAGYVTGGESYAPEDFGLSEVEDLIILNHGTRIGVHDAANNKILLYDYTGAQVANASDQSTITLRVEAVGR
jgi:hypothetical protein